MLQGSPHDFASQQTSKEHTHKSIPLDDLLFKESKLMIYSVPSFMDYLFPLLIETRLICQYKTKIVALESN